MDKIRPWEGQNKMTVISMFQLVINENGDKRKVVELIGIKKKMYRKNRKIYYVFTKLPIKAYIYCNYFTVK